MKRLRALEALLVGLLVVGAAAASATVYQYYYANATGTVVTPDVTLAPGGDSSASCSAYPCATVTVPATSDTATVAFSLFKADPSFTPPPATYYTDLVEIKDSGNTHSIMNVSITGITYTSASDFGKVIVYYCTAQCSFDSSGAISAGTSVGSFNITSGTGGKISGAFPQSIGAGGTQYIEVVAYAGASAASGDKIGFKVAIKWA